jgi:hypothetical protein
MDKKLTLAQKVLAVSESIGCVEKNGLNQHFKFKYQAWDDVLPAVRNACVEIGVQIRPSVVQMTNNNGHTVVTMQFTVCDASTNESEQFQWYGEAKGNDDKGIQKAITSCTKYALLKYFMIPIVDDTDTDAHGPAIPAANPKKAEPTKVDAPMARSVFVKKVFEDWQEIGGTVEQFNQLKTKLQSINFPHKATDLIYDAMIVEQCLTVEEVHRYLATTHKELANPFKLENPIS